ncbi:MAG TPA: DnaA regulatory inactivator Hda [Rudaea sp.]|nr:DnaA regulatory inactivator Hda [Rudaea sp.]
MSSQLPLALRWPVQQRFESFVAGENSQALAVLRQAAQTTGMPWIFVVGAPGCGKTHLLLSACADAVAHGRTAQYLPLARLGERRDAAIRDASGSDLLAIDDVDAIIPDTAAQHALFDLYNRAKAEKSTLLFAANATPTPWDSSLPDLVSRLSSCTQIVLKPLDENSRRQAVRQRARARGLELDDPVLDWLFAHAPRDLGALTALIERMDRESLAAKRRITVPFLRALMKDER